MLRSWWRQALVVLLVLLIASCSGGGCSSGCSSCGITPIAGGFDPTKTIPNSASVRVTKPGLEFLSANLPALISKLLKSSTPGVLTINVPATNSGGYNICPNGAMPNAAPPQCVVEIDLGHADLTVAAVNPDFLQITGGVPVVLRDLPVSGVPVFNNVNIAIGDPGSLTCNSSNGSDANAGVIPLTIEIPLVAETIGPRQGYTKVDVAGAHVNLGFTSDNIKVCSSGCGIFSGLCDGILSALKGTVFNALNGQIEPIIKQQLSAQLCTKANAAQDPPCPTGSHADVPDGGMLLLPDGGIPSSEPDCVYDDQYVDAGAGGAPTCVPTELGLEGHINLGTLLAGISPGTSGALDFALAASGNMNPAPDEDAGADGGLPANGITLGMLGGALPQPQSDCVPVAPNPIPANLAIPDQMLTDTVPNWPAGDDGPHFGLAIDTQFLNYALGSTYNSGLLCLGISTENFQQLNTGLVSFVIPSMKTLTFEQTGAAIAISTRPQKPPQISLGGGTDLNKDPLLSVLLPTFAIDFYVWSEDRFIRAFTFTGDVTVPINVQTGVTASNPTGGLLPTLGTLNIANGAISNDALVTDDPKMVASALGQVLGGIVGQLIGSGIPAINLSGALSSLGLTLTIPEGGVRKLSQGSETYLGIFGDLGVAGHPLPQIETTAQLVDKTVHAEAMQLTTLDPRLAPTLRVRLGSPADNGAARVEYSWRIDQGTWSSWAPGREVTIRDPMLYMQAKHVLQVSSRIAGAAGTQDVSPAEVPFTIDVLPPMVKIVHGTGGFAVTAWDVVSPTDALQARIRGTDPGGVVGEWSDWHPLAETSLPAALRAVDVQVRDEEGNVATVSSALIRGGPDPTLPVTGGCSGCTTGSSSRSTWPAILLGLAALAALATRRRGVGRSAASALALGSIVTVAAGSQGCSCGGSSGGQAGSDGGVATGCGADCKQPCEPGLPQGLIGAYTSLAKGTDGTLWVSGYNDAAVDPANGIDSIYGDLVVGKYDAARQAVAWVTVDGLPPPPADGSCPDNDPAGWRRGLTDSGPDVGLWTSLVLGAQSHPMVSYYDATNQALKFASSSDGLSWTTYAIYANAGSDAGRYSKMVLVNGLPVIAYLVIDTGTNGYSKTRVSLAHATVPLPASPSDWALEDALVDDHTPCRAQDCTSGQACVASSGVCTATSNGCDAGCSSTQACIEVSGVPTCTKVASAGDIHPYPDAVGDYVSFAATPTGLGLVVYDRVHGNLLGLTNAGGAWAVTTLDGETGSRAAGTAVDTGNDGIGASLYVSANGDWHVSYVDGLTETLKYLYVPGGALRSDLVPQVVDDGSKVDGAPFADGVHIVGDDSLVTQNGDGSISIVYQDATAGTLRTALGSTSPGPWALHAIAQPNRFAGFFPRFVPNDTPIANWWRWADPATQIITGDVAIVSP